MGGKTGSKLYDFIQRKGIISVFKPFAFTCLLEKISTVLQPANAETRAFCWWDSKRLASPEVPLFLQMSDKISTTTASSAAKNFPFQWLGKKAAAAGKDLRTLFYENFLTNNFQLHERFRAEWKVIVLQVLLFLLALRLAEVVPYMFYDPSRSKTAAAAPSKKGPHKMHLE